MVKLNKIAERAAPLPNESRIAGLFAGADLADAYAIRLPPDTSWDVETLARFILGEQAPWFRVLMKARDVMVAGFGIKTSRQLREAPIQASRIYIFRVYAVYPNEIILGEDDKHLDFRVSILLRSAGDKTAGETEVVVTTVVRCHNLLGRSYLTLISPFHRIVVRSNLKRAARKGWPVR